MKDKISLGIHPHQFEVEDDAEVPMHGGGKGVVRHIGDQVWVLTFTVQRNGSREPWNRALDFDPRTGLFNERSGVKVGIDLEALRPKPKHVFGYTASIPDKEDSSELTLNHTQSDQYTWLHLPGLTPKKWQDFVDRSQVMLKRARFGWDRDLVAMLDSIEALGIKP